METDGFGRHVEDDRLRRLIRPWDVPIDSEALGATCVDEVKLPFVFQEIVPVDVFETKHDTSVCRDDVSVRIGRKDVIGYLQNSLFTQPWAWTCRRTRPP
jgi:hypothetical protein